MKNSTMEIFTYISAVFSIIGAILNIQKKKSGFYVWIGTNIAWVVIDFYYGVYAQAFLFVVYTIISSWGIYIWSKKENL